MSTKGTRDIRIVVEQVPASPVSRPQMGLLNTMLSKVAPKPKKARL